MFWGTNKMGHIERIENKEIAGIFMDNDNNEYPMVSDYCSLIEYNRLEWETDGWNHAICQCISETSRPGMNDFNCGLMGIRLRSVFRVADNCPKRKFILFLLS